MESGDKKRWNEGAESWVEFVRSGKNYYSECLNRPALKHARMNALNSHVRS